MERGNYVYLPWQELPIFLSFTLLLSIIFLISKILFSTKPLNLPPSPPRLPIVGNLHQIGEHPDRSLRDLSQKYGPLMLLHFGGVPTVIVSSPNLVKEITKNYDVVFSDRYNTTASDVLYHGGKDIVFASYGDYWRQARKLCVLELLNSKRVLSFQSIREEEVSSIVNKIRQGCLNGDAGAVNFCEMMIRTSNNVTSRCILGQHYSCAEKDQAEGNKKIFCETVIRKVMVQLVVFSVGDFFPSFKWVDVVRGFMRRLKSSVGDLDAFYNQLFEERKAIKHSSENGVKDFVDILLQLQKDNMFNLELTDDHLKAIVQDMFFGGIETTSTTSGWLMAELMRNPRVMKKTQEEVRRVVGEKGRVDMNDLYKLDYFKCVVKETLRLHPPVPLLVPRKTSEAVQIGGRYTIPAGTRVIINAWAIQRDPDLWDQPEEFIPERFENSPIDYYKGGQEYFHFIPFGFGRRRCPGIMFGMVGVEYLMANLLYWFDWKLRADQDVDMTETYGISVSLKVPLYLVPTPYTPYVP